MNPEVKAKWVAALRSGQFQQGKRRLRSKQETFCCAGVLCELHARETDYAEQWRDCGDEFAYQNKTVWPDKPVMQWAGLVGDTSIEIDGVVAKLWEHNDGRRAEYESGESAGIPTRTFAEIADAIEAQL